MSVRRSANPPSVSVELSQPSFRPLKVTFSCNGLSATTMAGEAVTVTLLPGHSVSTCRPTIDVMTSTL